MYEADILFRDEIKVNKEVGAMWQQQGMGIYLFADEADVENYISFEILSPNTEDYCKGKCKSIEIEKIIDAINEKQKQRIRLENYRIIYTERSDCSGFEMSFSDKTKIIWYYLDNRVTSKIVERDILY